MAIRTYRAPLGAIPPQTLPNPAGPRAAKSRISSKSFAQASREDSFEDAHADSHVVERKVKKEHRAGRRELEAARRQQKEMREDFEFEEG